MTLARPSLSLGGGRAWLGLGLGLALGAGLRAAPTPSEPVQASLLVEALPVQVGRPVRAGILFQIAPGWHLYGSFPGASGAPTEVQLRAEVEGDIRVLSSPAPKVFVDPSGAEAYGYSDRLVRLAELPGPAPGAKSYALEASAQWVACDAETCIPGSFETRSKLPVGARSRILNPGLFERWSPEERKLDFRFQSRPLPRRGRFVRAEVEIHSQSPPLPWVPAPGFPSTVEVLSREPLANGERLILQSRRVPPEDAPFPGWLTRPASSQAAGAKAEANLPGGIFSGPQAGEVPASH